MSAALEAVRELAKRRHWRIGPWRFPGGRWKLFKGRDTGMPPMTLADMRRWLLLPSRVRSRGRLSADCKLLRDADGKLRLERTAAMLKAKGFKLHMDADGVVRVVAQKKLARAR